MASPTSTASRPEESARPGLAAWLPAALVLSGAAALASQVAFTRALALVVGSTARSAAVTLAAYLFALAAGAAASGRFADRTRRPALLLAAVWAAGALATAVVPEAIRLFSSLYVPSSPSSVSDGVTAFAAAFVIVALPTVFLGASFPLACRAAGFGAARAGEGTGFLAGWNTLGAVLGALVAPILVSGIGLSNTLLAAAAGLALVASVAAVGSRVIGAGRDEVREALVAPRDGSFDAAAHVQGRAVPIAVFVAGAATLSFEILFVRILAIDLGGFSATYAAVIAVFLLGLAAGSFTVPRLRIARDHPRAALAVALALAAAAAPAFAGLLFVVDGAADAVTRALAGAVGPGIAYLVGCAAAAALMALGPAIGLGAILPLAMSALARGGRVGIGRLAGRLSFLQSGGGVVGALATGYVVLDLVSTKAALLIASAALLFASFCVARRAGPRARLITGAAAATAIVGVVFLAPWRPLILDSHVFRGRRGADGVVVAAAEDAMGLVTVVDDRRRGDRRLYTDGFLAAGTGPEYRYMRLLGHVPALLAEREGGRAGVVCFGSGTTAGALARHPRLESIEIAEISRRVLEFAPLFEEENGSVLLDPRVLAVVDDGRRWLRAGGASFDLVTLEPLLPYTPSAVSLYSAEFSAIVRDRLRDGGVFCQWIPLHCVEPRDLASLAGAIVEAFPECALFVYEQSAVVIGVRGRFHLPLAAAARRGEESAVAEDLRASGCDSALDALSALVLDPRGMAALAAIAPPLRDDRPALEMRALPRWALASYFADNVFTLLEIASDPGAVADVSEVAAGERDSTLAEFARFARSRRALLRAKAFEDRWRFRALTGDAEAAADALAAAKRTLDEALAIHPGYGPLEEARRALR